LIEQVFGGSWTKEKLTRLRKYLEAYTMIFTKNPRAKLLTRIYVDAFAGSGIRSTGSNKEESPDGLLFERDDDASAFMNGSARVALEIAPPFHRYVFIEKDPDFARELENVRSDFPGIADRIEIMTGDANSVLVEWINSTSWHGQRAVVFLDPYGMQVEWQTIEAIARTKAIDLWLLFPLGQGVNRLLTREGPPPEAWANRLTTMFGTDSWREAFYRPSSQLGLFSEEPHLEKSANFDSIMQYFLDRLDSVFAKVAPSPLVLRNSRNNPIFLLCFAAANEKGAPTAVRIAQDLLKD